MEDKKMEGYIERLLEEYKELKEKGKKLEDLIKGMDREKAVEVGGSLLVEQYYAMKVYEMILFRRLVQEVAKGNLEEETLEKLEVQGEVEA